MKTITEIKRHASPATLPQALTWDGTHFWMSSLDTHDIFQLAPDTWEVLWQTKAPGMPFSIVPVNKELRVLCGETAEDDRYIRRLIPGQGFDLGDKTACPELTGSQLSFDGEHLHLSQWYNQLILKLDNAGEILRTIRSAHGIAGQVIVGDQLYLITTDDEANGDYWLTHINFKDENPAAEDIARIPFPARSLTHDGSYFWSNHRANNETVCFSL